MHRVLLLGALLLIGSCGTDRWEAFVYPDKGNLSQHVSMGVFDTLEQCRAESRASLQSIDALYSGDYECGLNCELPNQYSTIKVCEETRR